MKIDIYSEFNDKVKEIWLNFEKSIQITPFQKFVWLNHWQKSVGLPLLSIQPQIVHIHINGNTTMMLPLGIRKKYGVRILEWLGGINSDYMGPLFNNKNVNSLNNKKIWIQINEKIKRYDLMYLRKQKSESIELLDRIGILGSKSRNIESSSSNLLQSWDDYFLQKKKKLRSDSRRQKRRLEEIGDVKFIVAKGKNHKEQIIKTMITQKRRRYQETKVWDMLAIDQYKTFYEGLSKIDQSNSFIHCSELVVNNKSVATHVGIYNNLTFYYLMPAHEGSDWEKYSPGRILLIELIKWSIKNDKKIFDFTIGGEFYKKNWCDKSQKLFQISLATTFKGYILFYITIFFYNIKELLKSISFLEKSARFLYYFKYKK